MKKEYSASSKRTRTDVIREARSSREAQMPNRRLNSGLLRRRLRAPTPTAGQDGPTKQALRKRDLKGIGNRQAVYDHDDYLSTHQPKDKPC
jgi:hypothetical protein